MTDRSIEGIQYTQYTDDKGQLAGTFRVTGEAATMLRQALQAPTKVALQPSVTESDDQALWVAIRNRTQAISFDRYNAFIQQLFCDTPTPSRNGSDEVTDAQQMYVPSIRDRTDELRVRHSIYGVDTYDLLRLATEAFLILECGVVRAQDGKVSLLDPELFNASEEFQRLGRSVTREEIETSLTTYFGGTDKLPYLRRILNALLGLDPTRQEERLPYCDAVLRQRFSCPALIELIWSYWHEEGMLVQTMNAIAMRFQNRRGVADRDPLANLEIDPMRPLNNLLWGYIQNAYKHLTVARRAYEYDHHYGLTLYGKAVPQLRSADSRSKFLEAFHNLLYRAAVFFQEDADTTVIANGFPLLNALREVHLILAEAAHNQFGDLPWTARVEMLIEQWLLSRTEIREFLRGRAMVPYQELWMGQVDTMKKLQGWTDTTVTHFHELAVTGEQLLLSIRYGDWVDLNTTEDQAKNWARYWKQEIQLYIHAYLAVTGVDLAADMSDTRRVADRYLLPSVHLRNRLIEQRRRALPRASQAENGEFMGEVLDYVPTSVPARQRLARYRREG